MTMQETIDKFCERFDKNNIYKTHTEKLYFVERQWGLFISWLKETVV
jgi:hypothetical protein